MNGKITLLILGFIVIQFSVFSQLYNIQKFDQVSVETVKYFGEHEMDIYQAPADSESDRPLILFVHGGGFGGGARNEPEIVDFCKNMARRGIVTASMSYTLVMAGKSFSCNQPAKNKISTFESVANEIAAATNYLLKRSKGIRFNSENIILVGSSAGAEAVLHTAYSAEVLSTPPADFKYGGLISMAGAIIDLNWITQKSAIPMQFFHGTCDNLVPYAKAPHHYCNESDVGYLMLYGPGAIVEKLKRLKKGYYLITGCNDNHGWAGRRFKQYFTEIADFVANDVVQKKIQINASGHFG